MFNASDRAFRIELSPGRHFLEFGSQAEIELETSYLNSEGKRTDIRCRWTPDVEPAGLVEVDAQNRSLTATGAGIGQVIYDVSGSDGNKTASAWVAVTPLPNEVEPNNGSAAANELGTERFGYIDFNSDEDWFVADVPAGMVYTVLFRNHPGSQIELDRSPYHAASYSVVLFDELGNRLDEDVNLSYRNASGENLRLFIRVTGATRTATTFPYSLALDLQ